MHTEKSTPRKALEMLLGFLLGVIIVPLVVPPWWLLARFARARSNRFLRIKKGVIETPIVFYEHPRTKRIVAFIATIHLAEADYFAKIQKRIDALSAQGHRVLFERTNKLTPGQERSLTDVERTIASQVQFLFALMQRIKALMSLAYQTDGLTYDDTTWVNTDMSQYEIIQLFAQKNVTLFKKEKNLDELFGDDEPLLQWMMEKILTHFFAIAVFGFFVCLFSPRKRRIKRVILGTRNEVGFQGIQEHLAFGNVVTIWGAAHLCGMEKLLKRQGFKETQREWLVAYRPRNYRFRDVIAHIRETREREAQDAAVEDG